MDAYLTLFRGMGMYMNDASSGISYDDYKDCFNLYAVCLSKQDCMTDDNVFTPIKCSLVCLELDFGKPLPHTFTLVCLAYEPKVFEVNYACNILLS